MTAQPAAGLAGTADDLPFAAPEHLRLLESCGLTGTWAWTFATRAQTWSPGLYRLLGLRPGGVRPSYDLLRSLFHPEDRLASESPAELAQGAGLRDRTVRILRPDGSERLLACRGTAYAEPDGRPRAVAGLLLDVTAADALARARRLERQRRWALFQRAGIWTNAAAHNGAQRAGSEELLSLTGLSQEAFQEDCLRVIVPRERPRMRAFVGEMLRAGQPFAAEKRLVLADGGQADFRFLYVPMRNARGEIEAWATHGSRAEGPHGLPADAIRRALEQGLEGRHLRAARALLDWSMDALARASGVSVSLIRRLEAGAGGPATPKRHAAVAALRRAGIRFALAEGNRVAVART